MRIVEKINSVPDWEEWELTLVRLFLVNNIFIVANVAEQVGFTQFMSGI